mgnify:CR=1 FL=1
MKPLELIGFWLISLMSHVNHGEQLIMAQSSGEKELFTAAQEHKMKHDLVAQGIREALEPMVDCVELSEQPHIRSLPQLHHLERYVTGRARPSTGFFDLVHGLHPTPALGGYPRHHALAYLEDCEPLVRGGFGAPFGWVGSSRQGHAAVAIRAALLRGETASVYAGAGIVAFNGEEDNCVEPREAQRSLEALKGQGFVIDPSGIRAMGLRLKSTSETD